MRLALEDLAVLHDLPLDDRPRLIFGARLAGCEREPGGGWVVHFERDSGVLVTDHDAVVAALTQPPDEPGRPGVTPKCDQASHLPR